MFEKISPEKAGISSEKLLKTISRLEKNGFNFHSFLILKNGKLISEAYWKPFHLGKPHRLYSVTKSFVGVAIGALYTKGLIDLDAPFVSYFPEYAHLDIKENLKKQTIKDMLTMRTSVISPSWFVAKPEDRLAFYLTSSAPKIPGSCFAYDSTGSFALGCLVEKISGKSLLDFMRESFLDEIGFSKDARMLSCPGGHAWGDSALICSLRDLALFTQLVMNNGAWNGKQLIDKQYMIDAVSCLSRPDFSNDVNHRYSYGYQIWKPREDAFSFNGMGGQFGISLPFKGFIFCCNADIQSPYSIGQTEALYNALLELFDEAEEELPENETALKELDDYCQSRTLSVSRGAHSNEIQAKINQKVFNCKENPMGWKYFKFDFDKKALEYENEQGAKTLYFDFGKNIFQKFPQEGYSDLVGSVSGKTGHLYDCAVSASWFAGNHLSVFVQIIDDYFGRLTMSFCFPDENSCGVFMHKTAEDFLDEYSGELQAYS